MFEIENGSEMDNALTAIEKAVYYIRNCAKDSTGVEKAIEEIQGKIGSLENALEVLKYEESRED